MKLKTSIISQIIANETSTMTPLPTQKLFNDLFVVQDSFTNIYLIKNNDKYIAIDAGIDSARIKRELAKLSISPADIEAVLITHSDIDHVYGLDAFPNADLYLSQEETKMLNQYRITLPEASLKIAEAAYADTTEESKPNLFGYGEYWPMEDMDISTRGAERFISLLKNRITRKYNVFSPGESITLRQSKVQTISIPGHTKGLTAYLINHQYLFVGDGLSLRQGTIAPFNALLNLNEAEHLESISKLKGINHHSYLFTTHYGFTDNAAAAFEHWNS